MGHKSLYETCTASISALEDIRHQELKRRVLFYGEPNPGRETHVYSSHVLSYDQARKIPLWVAEHITAENLQGIASLPHLFALRKSQTRGFYH